MSMKRMALGVGMVAVVSIVAWTVGPAGAGRPAARHQGNHEQS